MKKRVCCAFVDYKKAFDTVNRTHLWSKLLTLGVSGRILAVIKNLYTKTKSYIRYNNQMSDLFSCNIGVRQGENLSPLLFSVYLNDLAEHISSDCSGIMIGTEPEGLDVYIKLCTLLYADDTLLLCESESDLQSALDSLYDYCNKWKLSVNTSKTKVVIFSRGKVKKVPKWTFGPDEIETQYDYTYLGVTFNYNGHFGKAVSKQVSQAKRALFSLLSKARKLSLPSDIQLHLFDSCITPILLYGAEVWGHADLKHIEVFHNQFCKQILRVHRNTMNAVVQGELGRYSMGTLVREKMLNFWASIVNGQQDKISFALYTILKSFHDQGSIKSRWLSAIQGHLNNLGLNYLWDAPEFNKTWFKGIVKQISRDTALQEWRGTLNDRSQCSFYREFKQDLIFEPYLTILDQSRSHYLTRLRTGNHCLPIMMGRYNGIDLQDRTCPLCNSHEIGDESHYIYKCTYFQTERSVLLDQNCLRPHNARAKTLLTTTDYDQLNKLAQFAKVILNTFINGK